ncbi:MAG: hypothetical protein AB1589_13630 [Cyanobacteriota bacterium]
MKKLFIPAIDGIKAQTVNGLGKQASFAYSAIAKSEKVKNLDKECKAVAVLAGILTASTELGNRRSHYLQPAQHIHQVRRYANISADIRLRY